MSEAKQQQRKSSRAKAPAKRKSAAKPAKSAEAEQPSLADALAVMTQMSPASRKQFLKDNPGDLEFHKEMSKNISAYCDLGKNPISRGVDYVMDGKAGYAAWPIVGTVFGYATYLTGAAIAGAIIGDGSDD